jgi:hypothetical protein
LISGLVEKKVKWNGSCTSAAKAAWQLSAYGTAEAVPLSKAGYVKSSLASTAKVRGTNYRKFLTSTAKSSLASAKRVSGINGEDQRGRTWP